MVSVVYPNPGFEALGWRLDTSLKYEDDSASFKQHTKYHMHRLVRANLVQSKATRLHPNGRQIVNQRLTLAHFMQWAAENQQSNVHLVKSTLIRNWWRDAVAKSAEKNPFVTGMSVEPSKAAIAAKNKREIAELIAHVNDWTQEVEHMLYTHCPVRELCGVIASFTFRSPFLHPIPAFVATKWRRLELSEEIADIRRTKFNGTPFLPLGFDWEDFPEHEYGARYQMDFQLNPSDLPPEAVAQWPEELRGNNVLQLFSQFCAEGNGDLNPHPLNPETKSRYMPLVLQPTAAEAQNPEILRPLVKHCGRVVEQWTKCDDFPHFRSQLNGACGLPPDSDEFGGRYNIDDLLHELAQSNGIESRFETKLGGYPLDSTECITLTKKCPHCGDSESPPKLLFEFEMFKNFYTLLKVVCCSKHPRDTVEMRLDF